MLTKDDINDAREAMRFNNVPRYDTIYAALASYSRVVALRQELVDFMASSHARPSLAIEDVLRKLDRALEG
jgi:hypothetical protein